MTLRKQYQVLRDCVEHDLELNEVLADRGLDYDSLRYINDQSIRLGRSKPLALSDLAVNANRIPVVSVFSGCAGLDLGFEAAGFEHLALVDNEPISCSTVRQNRPDWNVIGPPDFSGDVSSREQVLADLKKTASVKAPFEGVLIGGPPCQSFSIAANQRFSKSGPNFKRIGFEHLDNGSLLFDFVWLVGQLKPRVFLIENVPGLLGIDGGEQLTDAIMKLVSVGYTVEEPFILDAAQYDIPQRRQRLFIVGARIDGAFSPPEASTKRVPCETVFRLSIGDTSNHVTRLHKAGSIMRYMKLGYGEREHLGRVDRLDPQIPAKTVIAGGSNGGGRSHLHPHIPRTLSVRECARLQTFPDDYVFTGSPARQFTQVGNAVPPILACKIATQIYQAFYVGF